MSTIGSKIYEEFCQKCGQELHSSGHQCPKIPSAEELKAREGHGELCYYCGEPTNDLAANPGMWSIGLCHSDEPGVVKWHHEHCVSERLAQGKALEADRARWKESQVVISDFITDYHVQHNDGSQSQCKMCRYVARFRRLSDVATQATSTIISVCASCGVPNMNCDCAPTIDAAIQQAQTKEGTLC